MKARSTSSPTLRELGYYSEIETAQLLKLKTVTLRNWRAANIGPAFTRVHGNRICYPMSAVRNWLERRTVTPVEQPSLVHQRGRRRATPQPTA